MPKMESWMLIISDNLIRDVNSPTIDIRSTTHLPTDRLLILLPNGISYNLRSWRNQFLQWKRKLFSNTQAHYIDEKLMKRYVWPILHVSLLCLFVVGVTKSKDNLKRDRFFENWALTMFGRVKQTICYQYGHRCFHFVHFSSRFCYIFHNDVIS